MKCQALISLKKNEKLQKKYLKVSGALVVIIDP